jgi:hypothetical protein
VLSSPSDTASSTQVDDIITRSSVIVKERKDEANVAYNSKHLQRAQLLYSKNIIILEALVKLSPLVTTASDRTNMNTIQSLLQSTLLNMAAVGVALSDWSNVIPVCNRVLTMDHNNVKALYRRGKSYLKLGQLQHAIDDLQHVVTTPSSSIVDKDDAIIKQAQTELDRAKLALIRKQNDKSAASTTSNGDAKSVPTKETKSGKTPTTGDQPYAIPDAFKQQAHPALQAEVSRSGQRKHPFLLSMHHQTHLCRLPFVVRLCMILFEPEMLIDRDKIPITKIVEDGSVTKQILRLGFGRRPKSVRSNEDAHIHYIARAINATNGRATGSPFDSSRDRSSDPVVIPLWYGHTWIGLEAAIMSMQTGELSIVTIKQSTLYCPAASSVVQPPYTTANVSTPATTPSSSASLPTNPTIQRLMLSGADIPPSFDIELELELVAVTDGQHTLKQMLTPVPSLEQELALSRVIKDEVI